jgi:two-component system, OmpR family, response regulator RegX3
VVRVLVVEDEKSYSEALSYLLRQEGFETTVACSGTQALEHFAHQGADVVLLDLILPGLSGTEVCRQLRRHSRVPVIMLSAKDSETDKIVGLELGADDYLTKPYSFRELLARIHAVLRRTTRPTLSGANALVAGPVSIDLARHTVHVHGALVYFPLREFELLAMLVRHAEQVLTRSQLVDRLWGADFSGDTKTVDVHIKRIRAKIEPDPERPRYLLTVRGVGYKFERPR